jgi:outer membrane protein OmpA-like peptidoglycan-associated protein
MMISTSSWLRSAINLSIGQQVACGLAMAFLLALSTPPASAGEASAAPLLMKKDAISLHGDSIAFSKSGLTFSRDSLNFKADLDTRETSSTIEVTLAADVLFDLDKSEIRSAAAAPLHDLSEIIRSKAKGPVTIQGYTDALGGDAYNQRLSERRAASVKKWLVAREVVTGTSFTTAGFGARNPVARNRHQDGSDDPEGRQLNRRVTVVIRK